MVPGVRRLLLVVALVLASRASAQQPGTWNWVGYGCITVGPDFVTLEPCSIDASAAVSATAPVAGTLSFDLAWSQQGGSPAIAFAQISADGDTVLTFTGGPPAPPGWCGPTPCSGSGPGLSVHLDEDGVFGIYFLASGTYTGLTFSVTNLAFVADAGFLDLGGELDGALVAHFAGVPDVEALAGLGDVDGDGVPDLLVGRPFDSSVAVNAGVVQLRSGATGAVLHAEPGQNDFDYIGFAVDDVGDVDGDGVDDYLHDAAHGSGTGKAYLIAVRSGASGDLLHELAKGQPIGGSSKDAAGVGDIDLDGVPDVAVGIPLDDTAGADAGLVRCYSGATGAQILAVPGPAAGQRFGQVLAGAGDLDADGVADLVVAGTPEEAFNPQELLNQASMVSGATGQVLHTFVPGAFGTKLGTALDGAGDVNGDSYADALVALPGEDALKVYSGRNGSLLFTASGLPGEDFAVSVAGVGDLDVDGRDDILAGVPKAALQDGAARIFSMPGQLLLEITSYPPDLGPFGPGFGELVAAAGGDLTGDGVRDLLIAEAYGDALVEVSGAAGDHEAPVLSGSGTLLAGQPVELSLQGGPAAGSATLVLGASQLLAPFMGGVMVPSLDVLLPGLLLDGTGSMQLGGTWPAGVPSGFDIYAQAWCPSHMTPWPFVASNALQFIVP